MKWPEHHFPDVTVKPPDNSPVKCKVSDTCRCQSDKKIYVKCTKIGEMFVAGGEKIVASWGGRAIPIIQPANPPDVFQLSCLNGKVMFGVLICLLQ